jgi:hypothetical protein
MLWFGTDKGVSHFDGKTWTTFTTADGLAGDNARAIAIASDGAVWAGTGGGISRFDGQAWTAYTPADWQARVWDIDDWVTAMAVAPEGIVWVGRWGLDPTMPECMVSRGVSSFDGESWSDDKTLSNAPVHAIAVAPDGAVWFGTDAGVTRFDGTAWTTYSTAGR